MFFIVLILLTALLMEGVGTYVSIVGFGLTFHHDWVIMAIAAILDAGKLVSVSFLYQYWAEVKKKVTTWIMMPICILLMGVTSAGVYGYLVKNFQEAAHLNKDTSIELRHAQVDIQQLEERMNFLRTQKQGIDKQIAALPDNYVTARRKLIQEYKPEMDRITAEISTVNQDLRVAQLRQAELKKQEVQAEVTLGPVAYTAKVFNVSYEQAVNWLILMIVFVFDPLAIMLVLAANFLVKRRRGGGSPEPGRSGPGLSINDLKNHMRKEALDKQPEVTVTTFTEKPESGMVWIRPEGGPTIMDPTYTAAQGVPANVTGTEYTIPGPGDTFISSINPTRDGEPKK